MLFYVYKAINRGKSKNSGIQCNLIDELMLTGDSLDETPYWKILAHKRLAALVEAQEETNHVNREIRELHEKNESLRKKIANFKKIIKEFDEMKVRKKKFILNKTKNMFISL